MAKYYFDIHDESGIAIDDVGEEFSSSEAARNEALATIGGLIKDSAARHSDTHLAIEVRDERRPVLKVTGRIQTTLFEE